MTISYPPIGTIHTPFTEPTGMPIQPTGASGIRGTIEIQSKFQAGLEDLAGFSHIILLYHFHRSEGFEMQVVPFLDREQRGVFATRALRRPNPIGLSVVRLIGINGTILQIEGVDMLDGTPLLDIKPYVPAFDERSEVRTGWLERVQASAAEQTSDGRFSDGSTND
jgi:tRNA (adenine37-N6)-methyltransferase